MTLLDQVLSLCPLSGRPLSAYQASPFHVVLLFKETQFVNFVEIFPKFSVITDFAESRAMESLDIHVEFDLDGIRSCVTCRIENPGSTFFQWIETNFPSLMVFIHEILWIRSNNSAKTTGFLNELYGYG